MINLRVRKVILKLNIFIIFLSLVGNFTPQVQTVHVHHGKQRGDAETKCLTQSCLITAGNIKNYLDESINPCENFYEFACGSYIKNTIIPKGRGLINVFTDVEDLVNEQLRPIISERPQLNESKAIRLTKHFYASCVNQDEFTEEHTVRQMADILEELGGWPVLRGDTWLDHNFNWIETVKQFRRLGLNTNAIFTLNIERDSKNSSRRVLIVSCYADHHVVMNIFLLQTKMTVIL